MIDPSNPDYSCTPVSPLRPRFDHSAAPGLAPYVTIITPFYNTGDIFHETAKSVFQQSFQNWEWMIVNDASTDARALSVLDVYRHSDPRIKLINHATNQGPSAARNSAYRFARTPYVVQLDSDNLLEPTAIEKWLWYLESYPEYSFVKGFSAGFGAQEYLWDQGFHSGEAFLDSNRVDATSMLRTSVHQAVGGYDETIRDGLEDWDFWLRCASLGYWGGTVPEYLDWYRRRPAHSDRWKNWDEGAMEAAFREQLRRKYPRLWDGGFPQIELSWHRPDATVPDEVPFENQLRKDKRRLLMLMPWLTIGGSDKFSLDLVQQLVQDDWEIIIATTLRGENCWFPLFARYTPDIFILQNFLRLVDYPRFLKYLIRSRNVDQVLITHSELGYLLLPYLRAHFPEVTFVDFCHIEELYWKNGGYPRMSVDYQELLDLNVVASEHLKRWMGQRGADSNRIEVCYTNIDPAEWRPDPGMRLQVRHEFGLEELTPVILFVGRIDTQKQPHVLAETLSKLNERGLDFVTLVAGDGPEFGWLSSFVRDHDLDSRVHLLGAVSNQRIKQLMAAADIFFLPSQWEGIALSLFEAMACGLTIVGADVGGQKELVTPECGMLIGRSDQKTEIKRYTQTISELLVNPEIRTRMAQAARERIVSSFRLDRMGKRMIDLLEAAEEMHSKDPRPHPSTGLGRACAARAVEYVRLSQLSDQLWKAASQPEMHEPVYRNWRERAYLALYRWHEPIFHWYSRRGWTWIHPIRERIKRLLLRMV